MDEVVMFKLSAESKLRSAPLCVPLPWHLCIENLEARVSFCSCA